MQKIDEAQLVRAHLAHARTHLAEVERALDALGDLAEELSPDEIVKQCACGARYDRAAWGLLEYLGQQDDGHELYEVRNCACGSTISIVIGPSPAR
jgi:hypothetical protein